MCVLSNDYRPEALEKFFLCKCKGHNLAVSDILCVSRSSSYKAKHNKKSNSKNIKQR